MSNRASILEQSFLFEGFEMNGTQVYPLSANRRAFLRGKGNSICEGEGGNLTDLDEVAECLLACTLKPEELLKYSDDEWAKKLHKFTVGSPDGVVEKFAVEIQKESERLQHAAVESLGKGEAQ